MATEAQLAAMEKARAARDLNKQKSPPLPNSEEHKIDNTKKGQVSAPWRPARITDIPLEYKDPNYVYRFIHDTPNSIRKRNMEQWEIDIEIAKKMDERFGPRNLSAGLTIDGAYRVNELILVRMPKQVAESRKEYFKKQSMVDSRSMTDALRGNIREDGGEAAGVYSRHPSGGPEMNKSEKWGGQM